MRQSKPDRCVPQLCFIPPKHRPPSRRPPKHPLPTWLARPAPVLPLPSNIQNPKFKISLPTWLARPAPVLPLPSNIQNPKYKISLPTWLVRPAPDLPLPSRIQNSNIEGREWKTATRRSSHGGNIEHRREEKPITLLHLPFVLIRVDSRFLHLQKRKHQSRRPEPEPPYLGTRSHLPNTA